MSSARQDVQRLFGHFGLDPADYIVSFACKAEAPTRPGQAGSGNDGSHSRPLDAGDRDLFDYRNFDLGV
jgi:hypothetical protein